MGTFIRSTVARAGVDGAQATRLCLADEAAAALAALSDAPEADSYSASVSEVRNHARGDAFAPKPLALARGFASAPPPDFAKASFAELYAWSLAQSPAE
jgi:hypothetical protein